jgi:hypothetical protein
LPCRVITERWRSWCPRSGVCELFGSNAAPPPLPRSFRALVLGHTTSRFTLGLRVYGPFPCVPRSYTCRHHTCSYAHTGTPFLVLDVHGRPWTSPHALHKLVAFCACGDGRWTSGLPLWPVYTALSCVRRFTVLGRVSLYDCPPLGRPVTPSGDGVSCCTRDVTRRLGHMPTGGLVRLCFSGRTPRCFTPPPAVVLTTWLVGGAGCSPTFFSAPLVPSLATTLSPDPKFGPSDAVPGAGTFGW